MIVRRKKLYIKEKRRKSNKNIIYRTCLKIYLKLDYQFIFKKLSLIIL